MYLVKTVLLKKDIFKNVENAILLFGFVLISKSEINFFTFPDQCTVLYCTVLYCTLLHLFWWKSCGSLFIKV